MFRRVGAQLPGSLHEPQIIRHVMLMRICSRLKAVHTDFAHQDTRGYCDNYAFATAIRLDFDSTRTFWQCLHFQTQTENRATCTPLTPVTRHFLQRLQSSIERGTRTTSWRNWKFETLPGCPSLDRSRRGGEVGFQPLTFRSQILVHRRIPAPLATSVLSSLKMCQIVRPQRPSRRQISSSSSSSSFSADETARMLCN
ncbi:hypothetical protein CSKR_102378, partial [Clonorchis sinensis]